MGIQAKLIWKSNQFDDLYHLAHAHHIHGLVREHLLPFDFQLLVPKTKGLALPKTVTNQSLCLINLLDRWSSLPDSCHTAAASGSSPATSGSSPVTSRSTSVASKRKIYQNKRTRAYLQTKSIRLYDQFDLAIQSDRITTSWSTSVTYKASSPMASSST